MITLVRKLLYGPLTAPTDNSIPRFDGTDGLKTQPSLITIGDTGVLGLPDDVRQIFNPGANAAGLNVGAHTADPGTPVNGDIYYDSANNLLRARINAAWVSLGASSGGGIYCLRATFDGGGVAPTANSKVRISIPVAGNIVRARLLADIAGTAVVDIWKDTYANYPPTVADTITAAAKPTLAGPVIKNEDTTLTGWTVAVSAGDALIFNLDSAATLTWLICELFIQP